MAKRKLRGPVTLVERRIFLVDFYFRKGKGYDASGPPAYQAEIPKKLLSKQELQYLEKGAVADCVMEKDGISGLKLRPKYKPTDADWAAAYREAYAQLAELEKDKGVRKRLRQEGERIAESILAKSGGSG